MKRSTGVAVIVAAAVLGCGGGTYVAASMPDHQGPVISSGATTSGTGTSGTGQSDSGTTASGSSDTESRGGTGSSGHSPAVPGQDPPTTDAPLFYLAEGKIHDGDREVEVELTKSWPTSSLQRLGDGWLVTQLHSEGGDQEDYVGTVVYADGSTWDLGAFGIGWDITSNGQVLFSPERGHWINADPKSRRLTDLDLDGGSGDAAPLIRDADPESWIQWTGSGVLTGWDDSDGAHLVASDPTRGTSSEVGPPGVMRPNTSPDGEFAVGDSPADGEGKDGVDACLTGGPLNDGSASGDAPGGSWWRNCHFRRLGWVSPYSPNGRRLLTVDADSDGYGPTEFDLLEARTGAASYMIDAPQWTYDAAWADDETLTVLAHPNGTARKRTLIYRVGLGGNAEQIEKVKGKVTLGSP